MHLRTKLILLVALTWLLSASVMYLLLSSNENKYVKEEVANRARSITKIVALLPELQNWIIDPDKHEQVQEMTEALRKETNVDFIVVFNNDGIRLSHPNVKNIGKHIEGNDELNALNGEEYISVAKGSLGESIRAFSPIYKDGKQIGRRFYECCRSGDTKTKYADVRRRNVGFMHWNRLNCSCFKKN